MTEPPQTEPTGTEPSRTDHLVLAAHRDGIARLTLFRPDKRNALNRALCDALTAALDAAEADAAVHVVLLNAAGPHFAAGADIGEMLALSQADAVATDFSGCCERLGRMQKPVIAAVRGACLGGGCELIEMADIVLAAETAVFGHPEVLLGTLSGAGGTQRPPRSIGKAKAMDLLLTGRQISAREAESCGLISRVVPDNQLDDAAAAVAGHLAGLSPPVLRRIKQSVLTSFEAPLAAGLALERQGFHLSFGLTDRREGMRAFLEKRPAQFTGG